MEIRRREHSGFTLVELLVVIAIVAVLAGLLFPVFARAREQGRRRVCVSNMQQIGIALGMYLYWRNALYADLHVKGVPEAVLAPPVLSKGL